MKTSTQPTITANEDGQVVIPNPNKPDFGYIRVEQEKTSLEGGFLNHSVRSALIGGQLDQLKEQGFSEGQKLQGQIVVEESLEPFYSGQEPKINPQTSEILVKDGSPIYRQSRYTANMDVTDSTIQHTNQTSSVSETSEEEQEEPVAIQ